jgi:UDP-N-acetylmuramoyl-L-alanyl-D-glutamate--2,6-diaminopimelate ligase
MPLARLLEAIPDAVVDGRSDTTIAAVECDSRRAGPGTLFAALRGWREDGHRYVEAAAAAGAVAVLSAEERRGRVPTLAWVRVRDDRTALALAARRFHGEPDLKLSLVGITGTKGKTTTAWLLESMIEAAGGRPGGSGTVRVRIGETISPAALTTPDAPTFCALLARMAAAGCTHAVAEISSQALDQRRVEGLRFRCAAFTNLSRDHLDYHGDMEAYFQAKARLFRSLGEDAFAVLPTDDPHSARLAGLTRARIVTYSSESDPTGRPASGPPCAGPSPDVWIESSSASPEGSTASLATPRGRVEVHLPLPGRHNLRNLAAAAAAACALDLPPAAVAAGAARVPRIPGRFEPVAEGQPFLVIVDYAHTEDALVRALESLRALARGRLLCVFGCGGDRDRGKRAPMGAAAARLADLVFLTSDNPRGEDPMAILREVERGARSVRGGAPYRLLPDRGRAIEAALREARPGDAVLIAGKGHEREQILADRRIPFDDREEARRVLRLLASERAGGDDGGGGRRGGGPSGEQGRRSGGEATGPEDRA